MELREVSLCPVSCFLVNLYQVSVFILSFIGVKVIGKKIVLVGTGLVSNFEVGS